LRALDLAGKFESVRRLGCLLDCRFCEIRQITSWVVRSGEEIKCVRTAGVRCVSAIRLLIEIRSDIGFCLAFSLLCVRCCVCCFEP